MAARGRPFALPFVALVALVASGCEPASQGTAGSAIPVPPPATAAASPEEAVVSSESPDLEGSSAPAAPAPPPPGVFANLDPADDDVVGPPDPLDDCEGELARAGVTFRAAKLPVHETKKGHMLCGAPQVVTYLRGPGKIKYSSPPVLTCKMALALAWFESLAQKEAEEILKARIVRIDHLGTYACREMAAYPGWVSEHSYANAIDLSRFVLASGKKVDVLRDFDTGGGTPAKPGGRFLRVISQRASDEGVFSDVLTPFFDARHKNHFHVDLARYRNDGTRPP